MTGSITGPMHFSDSRTCHGLRWPARRPRGRGQAFWRIASAKRGIPAGPRFEARVPLAPLGRGAKVTERLCGLGSGPRYMIRVTLFYFACNSRMSVCFVTRATCKNVRQNLRPRATAYCELCLTHRPFLRPRWRALALRLCGATRRDQNRASSFVLWSKGV